MIYLQLFKTFLLIGLFSFGGGYASMELIRSRVVDQQMWLSTEEFTDIISIAEMTPGPLGINIASFTGIRVGGVPGTLVATISYVLPAMIIVIILAKVYLKYRSLNALQGILRGLRPGVVAMVVAATVTLIFNAFWQGKENIIIENTNIIAIILSIIVAVLLQKKKIGPIQAILMSGIFGGIIYGVLDITIRL